MAGYTFPETTSASFPLLVRVFTVAIMAGSPFSDKLRFFVESRGITVAIMAG